MAENGNRHPNEHLRYQRRLRGWTLDDVAEQLHRLAASTDSPELGVDAHMVGRWERGVRKPAPRYVALLCQLFELSADALGLVDGARPAADGSDGSGRSGFLEYLTVVNGAGTLDWDRLSAMLRGGPSSADDALVEDLGALTRSFAKQVETRTPRSLLPALRSHLNLLTGSLQASQPEPVRRRLLSLTGETSALAGWLSYLLENRGDARLSWAYALELAREAGDDTLFALTLAMQRILHSTISNGGRYGNTARAIALLDQAEAKLRYGSSAHAYVMVLAKRAEEHAASGDAAAAHHDLERAEGLLQNAPPPEDGFFTWWDGARIAGYRGSCALALGEAREASAVLETALADTSASLIGQRCAVATDLAAALARQGEVERSCQLLTESLDTAEPSGLEELVLRVAGARQHLRQWEDAPDVRRLDERLAAHV